MNIKAGQMLMLVLAAAVATARGEHFRVVCNSAGPDSIDVACEDVNCCSADEPSNGSGKDHKLDRTHCIDCVLQLVSQDFASIHASQSRVLAKSVPVALTTSWQSSLHSHFISRPVSKAETGSPPSAYPLRGIFIIQV